MKKSTLTAIMYGVIIVLVIGIIASVILINNKPKTVYEEESPSISVENNIGFYEESTEEIDLSTVIVRVRVIDDNINVRLGPGTEQKRLGSAYYGNTFEYISQSHDGWTKIIYDGKEAYIFTEYVELVPMVEDVEGGYTEYLGADAPSQEEMAVWSDEGTGEAPD